MRRVLTGVDFQSLVMRLGGIGGEGGIEPPQPGVQLAFDAMGMDPATGEMLGVKEGVGGLTEGRASSIWLPDYEGIYREFLANELGWSGGRVTGPVGARVVYGTYENGDPLPEMPYGVDAPQATNLINRSSEFERWTKVRTTVDTGATDPYGGTNARKLVETAEGSSHYVWTPIGLNVGNQYAVQVIAKAGERKNLILSEAGATANTTTYDLLAGTVIAGVGSITALNDGWYLCERTRDLNYASVSVHIADDSGNIIYDGDGTSGLYLWQSQAEADYPSPIIPTLGTTVIRNACNLTYDRANIQDEAGSLYVEVDGMLASSSSSILSLFLGTISNNVRLNDGGSFTDLTFTDGYLRIGAVWGDGTMRLNVNGSWSTEQAYDGTLPDAVLDLFRNTISTKKMRGLQVWDGKDESVVDGAMA